MKKLKLPRPAVIAHRGASGLFPENTLLAIREARNSGADFVEIDVRMTLDGHLVLLHDATVKRTTDGVGKVRSMTLSEIRALDAGCRFTRDGGQTYPFKGKGVRIPILDEVLVEFPGTRFQIELKENSIELATKVLALIREHRSLERTQIATASGRLLQIIKQEEPRAVLAHSAIDAFAFVVCAVFRHSYSPCFSTGFVDLPLHLLGNHAIVERAIIQAARVNLKIRAYTVNDLERMKQLAAMGVAGFFTDYPGQAQQLLDTLFQEAEQC